MKIKNICLSLFIACALVASAMTDRQVIDYIKQQTAAGKSNEQIGKELMAKGVTKEQAQRIKKKMTEEQSTANITATKDVAVPKRDRTHEVVKNNNQQQQPQTQNNQRKDKNDAKQYTDADSISDMDLLWIDFDDLKGPGRLIYGHDIFGAQSLTFEPSENLATPKDYQLGPGDEVIIDIWGASEDHIRETISPEGNIMVSQVGPIYLNGMTIEDANSHIRNTFAKKYAGVGDEQTDVQLTLGQVRTIQVDVLGEVMTPGTFRVSPFSNVFHALYNAGGINDIGTLRDIQVLRNGKIIAQVDLYDYLFNGNSRGNIRLQEGDAVIVHPYEQLVNIEGNVKRPMYYEIKKAETMADLLKYAGGFAGDAFEDMVTITRQAGQENELYNVDKVEFPSWQLEDGDQITVGTILDRYTNRVEVQGAVFRPGMFAISGEVATVGDLVNKAGGLTEDAFSERVQLYREGPDKRLHVMAINLNDIVNGRAKDVALNPNDVLVVSSILELEETPVLHIEGAVANPGYYPYAINTTVKDLIFQAGGLLEGASTARVDIARRIVNPTSTEPTSNIAEIFSVSIEDGLGKNDQSFVLRPFDRVEVRKSPGYSKQRMVSINGEVLFSGQYALQKRNERLSEVVARAGGVLDDAFIKGAHLARKLTEAEIAAREEVLRLAKSNSNGNQSDSIALSQIQVSSTYNVGIDLEKALKFPGSTYDVVLRDGDELYVPQMQSIVKISGDVLFPNAVVYEPGKKLSYYIDQAGGYGQNARKGRAFIVYMNGTVARAKKNTPIEPGCQIIVPSKPANDGTDWTKILTIATSFSSVAAMAATITNIFKK